MRVTPGRDDAQDPASWREVTTRINRDLMGIATSLFALIHQTLKSAARFVTGIGNLPHAVGKRVSQAHALAEIEESRKREIASKSATLPAQASETLLALLKQKQVQGFTVRIVEEGGRVVLAILPPTPDDTVQALAATAIRSLNAGVEESRKRDE
jgi:hypothetical protein